MDLVQAGAGPGGALSQEGAQPREATTGGLPGYKAITHTGQAAWAGEGSQIIEQAPEVSAATS